MPKEKHIEGIDPKIAVDWGLPESENPVRNTVHRYLKFKDSSVFSPAANFFKKHKCYTFALEGTIDYDNFWDEEERRCFDGFTVGGVRITGRHYYYLNYCQIKLIPTDEKTGRPTSQTKVKSFPRFLDHNYYYLLELEKNLAEGPWKSSAKRGNVVTKGRRKGHTYIISGAIFSYNYTFIPESMNMLAAGEKDHFKVTLDAIHDSLNNTNENTAWGKKRLINQRLHLKSGYLEQDINGVYVEKGYRSEMRAISFADNPFKSIGESCTIVAFEEAGKFDGLVKSIGITEPTYREGETMIGIPICYGCVCKGTKVWTNDGKLVNIEDLQQSDGILGYNGNGVNKEPIIGINPPAQKECVSILYNDGTSLDCSIDHPIVARTHRKDKFLYAMRADSLKKNFQVASIDSVGIFGIEHIKDAYMIGLMIGDGYYPNTGQFSVSIDSQEVLNYINDTYDSYKISKFWNTASGFYTELRFSHTMLREEFKRLGLIGQAKFNKRLPKDIHTFDRESISNILAGLFDADGNINAPAKAKNGRIVLTSVVKELIEQVKYELLRFGIHSTICRESRNTLASEEYKGQQDYIYRLYINKKIDCELFYNQIPIKNTNKLRNLKLILERDTNRNFGIIKNTRFKFNPDFPKCSSLADKDMLGLRHKTIVSVTNIGMRDIYNLNAGDTHTYIANGIVTSNTGGDMSKGTKDLHEIFYDPKQFLMQEYDNIYDNNASGTCGYFIDSAWFYPCITKKEYVINGETYPIGTLGVDAQGNSNRRIAYAVIMEERESRKNNKKAYNDFLTQYPLTPAEAFLKTAGTIFDTITANMRLSEIEAHKERFRNASGVGTIEFDGNSKPYFKSNRDLSPIYEFPLKDCVDKVGSIIIYEHPVQNENGIIKKRYVAGIDSYDNDASGTNSMGSIVLFDRLTSKIVAQFKGRPRAADFYETCRRLLLYYNATANYEKANLGIYNYFDKKGFLHLLCDQPEIVKEMGLSKVTLVGNRRKGTAPVPATIAFGLQEYKAWTESVAYGEPKDSEITNMMKIESESILKETIAWEEVGNYDDISAIVMLFIYIADLAKFKLEENKVALSQYDCSFFKRKLI